jgi:hypothetical protein
MGGMTIMAGSNHGRACGELSRVGAADPVGTVERCLAGEAVVSRATLLYPFLSLSTLCVDLIEDSKQPDLAKLECPKISILSSIGG